MNCQKIRDLLMTDYIDGELDRETTGAIYAHIEECSACRTFEEQLRAVSVKEAGFPKEIQPPQDVWINIRDRIEPKARGHLFDPLIENLLLLFHQPRYAYAALVLMIGAAAVVGRMVWAYQTQKLVGIYMFQQFEFLSFLFIDDPGLFYILDINLGTFLDSILLS